MSRGLFLFLACMPIPGQAQEELLLTAEADARMVLVRGVVGEDPGASPLFQATWRFAGTEVDPVMSFQRTAMPEAPVGLMLDRLVLTGLGAYLDAHVHFEKQGVRADLPVAALVRQLNGMVRAATDELGEGDGVAAVSEPTMRQLDRLCRIDWSQARFGVDGGAEQDKYLAIFYYVRSQREELERQLRADLLPLAGVPVLRPAELPPGRTVAVNSLCGTVFDEQNYLCALDLAVSDTLLGLPDAQLDGAALASLARPHATGAPIAVPEPYPVRKRDRWLKAELDRLNERIDQADQRKELWALRDRLDDLEGRMDDITLELQDVRAGGRTTGNPIAELSALTGANITVHFASGSTTVEPEDHVLLNEVFEQLARDPRQRLLITGHSDSTGDAATNLRLSELRARAVRDHLLRRGVAEDRLLVNFFGDARSTGDPALDRRVELEWIAE